MLLSSAMADLPVAVQALFALLVSGVYFYIHDKSEPFDWFELDKIEKISLFVSTGSVYLGL